jgi:uncharacterized membrane protein (UPF0127 family)
MLKPAIVKTELVPKAIKNLVKNNLRIVAPLLLALIVGVAILTTHYYHNRNQVYVACGFKDNKTITIGSQKIAAELATTASAQQLGLGGRACIGQNEGMLFVFSQPSQYSMWMKDMKFPIDIVWIGSNHKTVGVYRGVEPSTYPDTFVNSDGPALYVLELASQRSKSLGITTGTPINF